MNCSQQTNGATNMATLLQKNCIKTLSVNNGVVTVGTAVPTAASSATTANMQPMIANASHVQPLQAFQYQQLQTVQAQPQYLFYNSNDGTLFRPVTTTTQTIIANNIILQQSQPQPIITQSNLLPKIGTITNNVVGPQRVVSIVAPRKPLQHATNIAHINKLPALAPVGRTPAPASLSAPAPATIVTTKSIATKAMPIINPSNQNINLGQLYPITTNGTVIKRIDNIIPTTSASSSNSSNKMQTLMLSNAQPIVVHNRNVGNAHQIVTNTLTSVQNTTRTTTPTTPTIVNPIDTQTTTAVTVNNSKYATVAPPILPASQPFAPVDKSHTNRNERTADELQPNANNADETTTFGEDGEPEPEIDIVINNVVCSFSVRCHLNLREIALNGRNVEFRRENGMVTMKLRKPYTTASIWSSGRITCTGATSEDQAKVGARRYARLLQSLGFPVRFNNFRVVNVLGTCSMPWAIKIVNFSETYKKDASYEPELHPGVTYKLKTPKATLKIFSTGSITVTAASVADVQSAIEHIFPLVYEFRKKRIPVEPVQPAIVVEAEHDDEPNEVMEYSSGRAATKPVTQKAIKRKYPFGMAENDPDEDLMAISDVESDADDNDDF